MIEQGTPEWHAMRCGKATASRIAHIIAKTKTGYSTSRANYLAELVVQRLTGGVEQGYTNEAMKWGTEKEPEARDAYAFYRGVDVEQIGFVDHPDIAMSGASPDGLVGMSGMVEIKCPISATHLDTLLTKEVPSQYVTQMQWQMACTNRAWCDFVSYDPRFPEPLRLFVKRVDRDAKEIMRLELEVSTFLSEVAAKVVALTNMMKEAA